MDKLDSFLQSEAWGEVQQAYGRKVQRVNGILAIRHKWYWFIPFGPYVDGLDDSAIFIRYEPTVIPTQDKRVADVHPSKTLLTPLAAPDEMLSCMKQKCRYNIHLAEKKSLQIVDLTPTLFFEVLQKTSRRQHIRLHPYRYYEVMIDVLKKRDMAKIYGVKYRQQIIAVAMVVYYHGMATYVHGGSDYAHRSLMAPYLLHWRMMTDAYQLNNQWYDWFGLSEQWPGVTKFKLSFGGKIVTRPGTFDHVLRPVWYTGYRMMKTLWT